MAHCPWATNPVMLAYHDEEWGIPLHDDNRLFEALVLDGAQAGLSWNTILQKRPRYREVFAGFDPAKVARFDAKKLAKLLADPGIVRNRAKIASSVQNARAFLAVQKEFGTFDTYLWAFINHKPRINQFRSTKEIPAQTPTSCLISKDLKKRGFNFVGPTIIYAMMQAIGMVNDHLLDCPKRHPAKK